VKQESLILSTKDMPTL